VRAVREATDPALRLDREPSLGPMVASPPVVRHFAHALMKRGKNEPIGVGMLIEFAQPIPSECAYSLCRRRYLCMPWRGAWSP